MKGSKEAFRTIGAALSILTVWTACAQADLVVDGDFVEDIVYWDSTGDIPSGWVTENSPDEVFWSDVDEKVHFLLASDYPSGARLGLKQLVALAPGTYALSFDYVFDSVIVDESDYFTAGAQAEDVVIAKEGIADNHDDDGGKPYWTSGRRLLTFTTVGGDVLLTFELERRGGSSLPIATAVSLDNVQLSLVPAPGAAILGVAGLAYSARRLGRRTA